MKAFTVVTHNTGDVGTPPRGTVVAVQERSSMEKLALAGVKVVRPEGADLALLYDPQRVTDLTWKLSLIHRGRKKVSPTRHILTVRCKVDGRRAAFLNTHLVNNAWGPVKRGERKWRRDAWLKGWGAVGSRKALLVAAGYAVFVLGDFNRKDEQWGDAPKGVGHSYDRIFYPRQVNLTHMSRGPRGGSDHDSIIGTFTWKKEKR